MFRCQSCSTVVPPGVRSHRLVTKTRRKVYEPRGMERSRGGFRGRRGMGGRSRSTVYDKGGEGTEIVQELMVCPRCAESLTPEPALVDPGAADTATDAGSESAE